MYSIEGLERGIEGIQKNIKVFEAEIVKERQRISDYRKMIEELELKASKERMAKSLAKTLTGG